MGITLFICDSVGWRQVLCIPPSPRQSPKENKLKVRLKLYVLQCTLYAHMNVHLGFLKTLSQMFQKYSELYLAVQPPTLQATFWEGWLGDCDLQLRHLPVDLRSWKVIYRRIPILMAAAILIKWHSDWVLHAGRDVPIECFNRDITLPLSRGY